MKIISTRALVSFLISGVVFSSCQKEVSLQDFNNGSTPGGGNGGGSNNINIIGDWNFLGTSAETYVALSMTEAGQTLKSITTSDYVTENYGGTLTVTDKQFLFKGITHSVDDTAHSETYINGALIDETDEPFEGVYPPTDQTLDYVRNTNDSITFTNTPVFMPDPSGSTTPVTVEPMGAKISLSNDTLRVITNYKAIKTTTQQGIPGTFDIRLKGVMKFKKR
jgi:hypothetical protein